MRATAPLSSRPATASGLPEIYRDRPSLQKPFQLETLAQVITSTLKSATVQRPARLRHRRIRPRRKAVLPRTTDRPHFNVVVSASGKHPHRYGRAAAASPTHSARRVLPIGTLRGYVHHRGQLKANPVIGIATTVAALTDFQKPEIALALPGDAMPLTSLGRAGRKVDVDHGIPGNACSDHLAHDVGPEFQCGLPTSKGLSRVSRENSPRQCEGWQSQNGAFPGRRQWCRNRPRLRQRYGLLLTPDSTRSGSFAPRMWRAPMITQSVGVPCTA